MEMKVKKLHQEAKLPKYAHPEDAGMDLYSLKDVVVKPDNSIYKVETGIALEIPSGYCGLIWDKGGISLKAIHSVGGVFDTGYRGDITVGVINLGKEDYMIEKGDKIAQILIQPVEHPELVEQTKLSGSARGINRFGSTGKK